MKKISLIIFSAIFAFSLSAQNKMAEANALYSSQNYDEAIALYKEMLNAGNESAALYYNLGNAYYKLNEIAPAILNYERALLLKPNDKNTLNNLELARSRTVDKIDVVDMFFLKTWLMSLVNLLSSNAWAWFSIITFLLFIVSVFFYFFGRYRLIRKIAFAKAAVLLVLSLSSFFFAKMQKDTILAHEYAIIFDETLTAKSSPDVSGTDLFILHSGTKVKIKTEFGNGLWYEIQLEDGNTGWVKAESVERI